MLKIKTKRIKEDEFNEYVGVHYKSKNTNNYEHLVLINFLLHKILETKLYNKNDLLKVVKLYLDKECE